MSRLPKSAGWLLASAACLGASGGVLFDRMTAQAQTEAPHVIPVEIKYALNSAGTAEAAQLSGPQDKQGALYTIRQHLKKGAVLVPHTHPDTRYTTVLEGTLYVCTTDTVSEQTAKAFPAGSFFIMPAGAVHCSWAKDGDVVYQESGIGPTAVIPVKK